MTRSPIAARWLMALSVEDTGTATASISGEPILNSKQTCVFNDDDPQGPASNITYAWKRNGSAISGATNSTYYPVSADVGTTLTCTVSYTDGAGFSDSVTTSGVTIIDGFIAVSQSSSPYYLFFSAKTQSALSGPASGAPLVGPLAQRLSPNKRWLAINSQITASQNTVIIYDMISGSPVYYGNIGTLTGAMFGITWSPDSQYFAIGQTSPQAVKVYDLATLSLQQTLASGTCVSWSPDGSRLAVALATSPYLVEYDTSTWTTVTGPSVGPVGVVRGLEYSPDGQYLAMVENASPPNLLIYLRSNLTKCAITGIALTGIPNPQNPRGLAWSPDSNYIGTGAGGSSHFLIATRSGNTFDVENATDDASSTAIGCIFNGVTSKCLVSHGVVSSKSLNTYNVPAFTRATDGAAQTSSPNGVAAFEANF